MEALLLRQVRAIFHEIRAHVTLANKGVVGGNAQHKKYGEVGSEDVAPMTSDAGKFRDEAIEAVRKFLIK